MTPDDLVRRALALVGAPFRLHGRDPEGGLDCIGLLGCALMQGGKTANLPNNYALRSLTLPDFATLAAAAGFQSAEGPERSGDVLILQPGPCQAHLAILCDPHRAVHAHAGLRRVVVQPAPLPWPIIGRWRLTDPSPS